MTYKTIANTGERLVLILPNEIHLFGQLREILEKSFDSAKEVVLVHLNKIRFIRQISEIDIVFTDIIKIQTVSKGLLANTETIIPKIQSLSGKNGVAIISEKLDNEKSGREIIFEQKARAALPCLVDLTFSDMQVRKNLELNQN